VDTPSKSYSSAQSPSNKPAMDLKDTASKAVDSVKGTVGDAMDRGQAAMSHAGAKANEIADSASQQMTTFASELTSMTRRNPLGALAGAAIAGMMVGLMARGRSNRG
jgi:ElaB/YqjD/DUF883 family membrane-anchored ribosome-binding protein